MGTRQEQPGEFVDVETFRWNVSGRVGGIVRDLLLPRLVSGEVDVSVVSTDEQRINGY